MRPFLRNLLFSASTALVGATAAVVLLTPAIAEAGPNQGEIWFGTGADSLETDDKGAVTSEGAKTKTKEVDRIPGEEDWEIKMAARFGGSAAEGPLYIEVFGKNPMDGSDYLVTRIEQADYDGSRNYNYVVTFESNLGFNKGKTYKVKLIQNNGKRDIVLGQGSVTLIDTGREAEGADEGDEDEGGEDEGGEDEEGEDEGEDGEDEGGEDEGGGEEAPPPIDDTPAKKKGCSVTAGEDLGATGLGILLLAGALMRRRRDD